jgi:hypothetical protein
MDLVSALKLHRDNLLKLIAEDAPSNKFLEELMRLRETALKFNLKEFFDGFFNPLDNALTMALSDYKYPSRYTRNLMIEFVYRLIKRIDYLLYNRKVMLPTPKPSDFPEYESHLSEKEVVDCFIQKSGLNGLWFKEFPAGLKKVDEVANEERKKGGFEWLSDEKFRNLFLGICKHIDLVLVELNINKVYERISEKDIFLLWKNYPPDLFSGKTAILIEAKASADKLDEAISQILEYKGLFQQDWKTANIKNIGIICPSWSSKALNECRKHNIKAWEVTCKEVQELT